MSQINLYPEMNEKIADFLLDCTDNGMLLYAGTYIKELEKKLAEYQEAESQGNILKIPIEPKTTVYSMEFCCGKDEKNKMGMCHKGVCLECADRKPYILKSTVEASCKIKELGRTVFFNRDVAERVMKGNICYEY